jgi:hypothetical protein
MVVITILKYMMVRKVKAVAACLVTNDTKDIAGEENENGDGDDDGSSSSVALAGQEASDSL